MSVEANFGNGDMSGFFCLFGICLFGEDDGSCASRFFCIFGA